MSRKIVACLTVVTLAALAACTKPAGNATARGALQDYVTKAFAVSKPADLDELMALTAEKAHAELDALKKDEALFTQAFVDQKILSTSSLRIRDERKTAPDRYSITYELAYKSHTPKSDDVVTVKKLAVITQDAKDSRWYIADVQNIKTFVEHSTDENISGTAKR